MANLNDVALLAGVSRATVSLVCRNSPLVAARTRQRVEQAMRDCGYVYNRSAANLRAAHSRTVGLVLPEIGNPVFAEVLTGIEELLLPTGRVVLVSSTGESLQRQDQLLLRLLEMRVDGLIVCAANDTEVASFDAYRRNQVPVVQVLRQIDAGQFDYAGTDNVKGMRAAARHLLDLGHRRIAYVGNAQARAVDRQRRNGLLQALAAARVEADPALMLECRPRFDEAAAAAGALMSQRQPPTAIACYNDVYAFGVMLGLRELGVEPGRDVSVTGFDDVEEAAYWRPALTTMSIGARGIGRRAARLLAERMDGGTELPPRLALDEAQLVVRRSSAPPIPQERET